MNPVRITGCGWAYIGGILGGAVSIAANVAHSYVPPVGAPADWSPPGGAVVGAVFWPVALFVAVEILARVAWPDGWRWTLLCFGGLVPVATVAAFVSYRHLSGLLTYYGEDRLTATFGPLAVDGLMVMATGALIATSRRQIVASVDVTEPITDEPVADPWVHSELVVEAPSPEPAADAKPAVRKVPRKLTSAEKVARAAKRLPNGRPAEIAARAGVSEATARRYMPTPVLASPSTPLPAETPAERINGHDLAEVTS